MKWCCQHWLCTLSLQVALWGKLWDVLYLPHLHIKDEWTRLCDDSRNVKTRWLITHSSIQSFNKTQQELRFKITNLSWQWHCYWIKCNFLLSKYTNYIWKYKNNLVAVGRAHLWPYAPHPHEGWTRSGLVILMIWIRFGSQTQFSSKPLFTIPQLGGTQAVS